VVRRTGFLVLSLVLAATALAPAAHAAVPVVVVGGRGHGHGVGMAQDGAYWMGAGGATMDQILDHFYPGTTRGSSTGDVRVVVFVSADDRAVLTFPEGGDVRSPRSGPQRPGFPAHVPPGGSATIAYDGSYHVEIGRDGVSAQQAGPAQQVQLPTSSTSSTSTTTTTLLPRITPPSTTSTTAPPPGGTTTTTAAPRPPARPVTSPEPVWAGPVSAGATVGVAARSLRYRGELEVSAAAGPLRVVDEIDVEQYLWGLGEVSASWSPAALQAQVVAARTYALRAMAANHEICDTQRCQVYKGATGEFRAQVDAVNATLGTTLGYGGRFASAVFSANAGGVTATPEEGFGTSNASHPYLVAAPYESKSDVRYEVRIGLAELARRLGYPGTATSLKVATTGPSGRPIEVEVDGDRGPQRVRALAVDSAMGLRSTLWTAHVETADAAPPPPAAAELIQSQPDEVGHVIADEQALAARRSTHLDVGAQTVTTDASAPRNDEGHGAVPWLLVLLVLAAGAAGLVTLVRAEHAPVPRDDA
jgi:SpoIID/LytB domain protein